MLKSEITLYRITASNPAPGYTVVPLSFPFGRESPPLSSNPNFVCSS